MSSANKLIHSNEAKRFLHQVSFRFCGEEKQDPGNGAPPAAAAPRSPSTSRAVPVPRSTGAGTRGGTAGVADPPAVT